MSIEHWCTKGLVEEFGTHEALDEITRYQSILDKFVEVGTEEESKAAQLLMNKVCAAYVLLKEQVEEE